MKINLDHQKFNKAKPIMRTLSQHGYEAYFVGGCVRDMLLKRPIHDVDIASSALPEEIETIFPNTVDLGKEHGTIIVVYRQEAFEVTTFRTESSYSDYRRPDHVSFVRNLKEDTLRRDFTINALAMDVNGNIFDYHEGISDLSQGIIRAVGNPSDRFFEDALRMVRAIRFSSELGFEIEENTFHAIGELAENIKFLSVERIRVELTKFFQGAFFVDNGNLLVDSGLAPYMPGFQDLPIEGALSKMIHYLQPFKAQGHGSISEPLAWTLFVNRLGMSEIEIKQFLKTWKHSNQMIKDVLAMNMLFDKFKEDSLNVRDIYDNKAELLLELELLFNSNGINSSVSVANRINNLPIKSKKDIVINGSDIIKILNLPKGGPMVGKIFDSVEQEILLGKLGNDYNSIEEYILSSNEN